MSDEKPTMMKTTDHSSLGASPTVGVVGIDSVHFGFGGTVGMDIFRCSNGDERLDSNKTSSRQREKRTQKLCNQLAMLNEDDLKAIGLVKMKQDNHELLFFDVKDQSPWTSLELPSTTDVLPGREHQIDGAPHKVSPSPSGNDNVVHNTDDNVEVSSDVSLLTNSDANVDGPLFLMAGNDSLLHFDASVGVEDAGEVDSCSTTEESTSFDSESIAEDSTTMP